MKTNVRLGLILLLIGAGNGSIVVAASDGIAEPRDTALDRGTQRDNIMPRHNLNANIGRTQPDARHEITELFMYTCPHCHSMAKPLATWASEQEADVAFVQAPVVFRDADVDYLRLHHGLISLGMDQATVQSGIFDAIHTQHMPLRKRQDFVALGIKISRRTGEAIEKAMDSFAVSSKVKQSKLTFAQSGAHSVPTFVVDGEYRIDPADAGSLDDIMNTLTASVVN